MKFSFWKMSAPELDMTLCMLSGFVCMNFSYNVMNVCI